MSHTSLELEYALFLIVNQICLDIEQSSLQETLSPFHTQESAALASAYRSIGDGNRRTHD
jgi:hypothetical protein